MAGGRPRIPVFDVGGVLLDWDLRHLYAKHFAGEEALAHFLDTVLTRDWWVRMDAGLPLADGIAELSARFPEYADLIALCDRSWPEMVRGVIAGTVEILARLKARGPVYAITNFPAEKFIVARRLWPFLDDFDGVVVSGEVRILKPDAAIFTLFLDRFGLAAGDCLFIDDSAANVQGARDAGMHGHHFKDPEELEKALIGHGML